MHKNPGEFKQSKSDALGREKICSSVEIPILSRCCFCFPLRKGLITFAYVNLVNPDYMCHHIAVGFHRERSHDRRNRQDGTTANDS
ncbi:unnamed protein product [Leptidea sinapis]|uniref:Uncharacterized protein n=1 Tax=Leptidea sinapis TaxID=189913 RepID=A0A5E4QU51_9NEOP|nr:unnamed protein product [Leptidea sinapis]